MVGYQVVCCEAPAITRPQGDLGGSYDLNNIIDQSGFSAGYKSGVTDFAAFTSTDTKTCDFGNGFAAEESHGPQQFTFDPGEVFRQTR